MLELEGIHTRDNGDDALVDINLRLDNSTINILLGPTLAGKTSLLRVMAGLDAPSSGELRFNGHRVTGTSVRQRNVAMVYQQFINYPNLSVFDNIASPLLAAGVSKSSIRQRVHAAADVMQLGDFLDRLPEQLSGGQQQRVALARALVKEAPLVLLDEPLANLDYKLREELRDQLPRLFADQGALLVYATSEPQEALQLGGNTVVLDEGRVVAFGPTSATYHRPTSLRTAMAFSDPPLNTARVRKQGDQLLLNDRALPLSNAARQLPDGDYELGLRPYHLIDESAPAMKTGAHFGIDAEVRVSEISGSETFLHFSFEGYHWVSLTHGVKPVASGSRVMLYFNPDDCFLFDAAGNLAHAPSRDAA